MELDFTKLNSIGSHEIIEQTGEKTPSEQPKKPAESMPGHEVKQADRAALKDKNETKRTECSEIIKNYLDKLPTEKQKPASKAWKPTPSKVGNCINKEQEPKQPQEAPKTAPGQAGENAGTTSTSGAENSPGGQNETPFASDGLQRKADEYRATVDRAAAAYKKYQQNILAAGQLRSEITKGTRAGEDIYTLFLKAAQAISCMTGDASFVDQIERNLKSVYGAGLREPQALGLEIQEVKTRLRKLRAAKKRETAPDSLARIGKATEAHEARLRQLEQLARKAAERPA